MIDKRLFPALPVLALLAACGGDAADEGAAASGEVIEGTISDAMLPLDRVRSEAPLEDPEAFVEAQSAADDAAVGEPDPGEASEEGEAGEAEEAAGEEPTDAAPAAQPDE